MYQLSYIITSVSAGSTRWAGRWKLPSTVQTVCNRYPIHT